MARSIGDTVKWNWGQGTADGRIMQIYKERVSKTLKGSEIVREGSDDNPAYLIEQEDGDQVLKLGSELD
ncbi:hypothetical protein SADO_13693 [Salinisphaera dokdonensis CL-ES53]|uniref:Hypervirulence associated protein TUDOR domain-containing protein n=1 Tax=Salinisphaera dokdonensis CL-ES53 TaxID=1304272 RepID=A0ABV2B423_9GAMM